MARAYLTPLALPAAPTSALYAAAKSYADASWLNLIGTDKVHVRYTSATIQSCANISNVVVAHGTAVETHSAITQTTSGAGHRYTFNTTGIWAVMAVARFATGGSAGERYHTLTSDMQSSGEWGLVSWGGYSAATYPTTMGICYIGKFTSGSYVQAEVYQNSAGSLNLEGNVAWKKIDITLIRKYT